MGYVKKTVSRDEVTVKKAKICWLAFLDRFIIAVLLLAAACFSCIKGRDAIEIAGVSMSYATFVMLILGAFFFVVYLVLGLIKLIQIGCKTDPTDRISARWLNENAFFALLGIALGVVGYFEVVAVSLFSWIVVGVCAFLAIWKIFWTYMRYYSIKLYVTDKRVFGRVHIFKTNSYDAPLKKIDTISVKYTFFGKIFNYATITIQSVLGVAIFKYVKSADEFKNTVIDFIAYEERNTQKDFIKYTAQCVSEAVAAPVSQPKPAAVVAETAKANA